MSTVFVHLVITHPATFTYPSLKSVAAQTYRDVSLVLVDNAAQDSLVPWYPESGPEVMILRNFRDTGFAHGHNQALSLFFSREPSFSNRIVILLSSHVILAPDAIQRLVEVLATNPSLMAVAPKVHRAFRQHVDGEDDPLFVDTGIIEQIGLRLTRSLEPCFVGFGEKDAGQYDHEMDPFLLGTTCLAIRGSALLKLTVREKWFDPDLPESLAMMDLAWRMRLFRLPTRLVPEALAFVEGARETHRTWSERVRAWYGVHERQARIARTYIGVLRLKNASFLSLCGSVPWLVFVWGFRLASTVFDRHMILPMFFSWGAIFRALRTRRLLSLAIRSFRT